MMRSMYSGVSGLRVHQTKMDVIGNNIANVNTVGFKRGQVTFQEVFSQVVRGGGAPQEGKGGTNPQQIGLGVKIGSIDTIHTKGATQRTDNATDLMIDGEGFFVVSDDPDYENRYYTRAGNFTFDRDGCLVTADGYKVLGYKYDENGEKTDEISEIIVSRSESSPPKATENVEIIGNLDSRTPSYDSLSDEEKEKGKINTNTIIKDVLGNSYQLEFEFRKTQENSDGSNEWEVYVKDIVDLSSNESIIDGGTPSDPITLGKVTFNKNGKYVSDTIPTSSSGEKNILSSITLVDGINLGDEKENKIIPDFSKMTQYANETDIEAEADGYSSGTLNAVTIDASGNVIGGFTNGDKRTLAQIILAKFDNSMGLEKVGNNFFINSPNSGDPKIGTAGSNGYGSINPGTLEMSNVDLSLEFTEMITTQRGFQANSRVITTTDEMLQELVNLKR